MRRRERGYEHVQRQLVQLGASVPRAGGNPADWLREALEDVGAIRLRHQGVHRYVFRLGRNRRERELVRIGRPVTEPYPKVPDAA